MAVKITSSGPRGRKTYHILWKNGELYDIADNAYAAKRAAAEARKKEKEYYRPRKNPTKAQKKARAAVSRKKSGIAKAVRGLLKKVNPSAAISGASVVKLKGGGLTIRPIKRGRR